MTTHPRDNCLRYWQIGGPVKSIHSVLLVTLLVGMMMSHAEPAQAYLDPGTGSMVLQLILGGVAGALVIVKLYWARLKSLLGLSSNDSTPEEKESD